MSESAETSQLTPVQEAKLSAAPLAFASLCAASEWANDRLQLVQWRNPDLGPFDVFSYVGNMGLSSIAGLGAVVLAKKAERLLPRKFKRGIGSVAVAGMIGFGVGASINAVTETQTGIEQVATKLPSTWPVNALSDPNQTPRMHDLVAGTTTSTVIATSLMYRRRRMLDQNAATSLR